MGTLVQVTLNLALERFNHSGQLDVQFSCGNHLANFFLIFLLYCLFIFSY
jgi:hypothetical protein